MPPVEPLATSWVFPDPGEAGDDVVAVGADLEPGTILAGYRSGLFPMHIEDGTLGWWSPLRRGVIPLDGLVVSHSLAKSRRRFGVTIDLDFEAVIDGCSDRDRPQGWINADIRTAYRRLHELGWAHSVETRDGAGRVVGGLYGVAIGAAFFGESMFHRARDASKVALVALVELLAEGGGSLLDVQWATPHLRSLGAVEVGRRQYLQRLSMALARPLPVAFGGPR